MPSAFLMGATLSMFQQCCCWNVLSMRVHNELEQGSLESKLTCTPM